jgi:predicted MFS family arabinose efflux permease
MSASFGVPATRIGTALLATQVGYGLGMILLVPLGDGRERRGLIVTTILAAVPALAFAAAAPNVYALTAASLLIGVTSAVPQMILPYAVDLGRLEDRGRIVGSVMGGLLAGILLSRTVSGALGAVLGFRGVFALAAIAMLVLALVLRVVLPRKEPAQRIAYVGILRSLLRVLASEPELQRRCVVGGLGFASFSVFWSMLSFHLRTLGFGSAAAGAFGVIGLSGIVFGPIAARLATRPRPSRINVVSLLAIALGYAIFFVFGHSLLGIGVGVVLLDAGVQASHLTNQTVVFGMNPAERNRLNAIYMVSYFAGGGLGTFVAAQAWARGGWPLVCASGAALAVLAMVPLFGGRRASGPGAPPTPSPG